MERLDAGASLETYDCPGGEELFLLSGDLTDEAGSYKPGAWMRIPAGSRHRLSSDAGAVYRAKRGHLNSINDANPMTRRCPADSPPRRTATADEHDGADASVP